MASFDELLDGAVAKHQQQLAPVRISAPVAGAECGTESRALADTARSLILGGAALPVCLSPEFALHLGVIEAYADAPVYAELAGEVGAQAGDSLSRNVVPEALRLLSSGVADVASALREYGVPVAEGTTANSSQENATQIALEQLVSAIDQAGQFTVDGNELVSNSDTSTGDTGEESDQTSATSDTSSAATDVSTLAPETHTTAAAPTLQAASLPTSSISGGGMNLANLAGAATGFPGSMHAAMPGQMPWGAATVAQPGVAGRSVGISGSSGSLPSRGGISLSEVKRMVEEAKRDIASERRSNAGGGGKGSGGLLPERIKTRPTGHASPTAPLSAGSGAVRGVQESTPSRGGANAPQPNPRGTVIAAETVVPGSMTGGAQPATILTGTTGSQTAGGQNQQPRGMGGMAPMGMMGNAMRGNQAATPGGKGASGYTSAAGSSISEDNPLLNGGWVRENSIAGGVIRSESSVRSAPQNAPQPAAGLQAVVSKKRF